MIGSVMQRAFGAAAMPRVVIVDAVRTPVGSFQGSLSSVPAPELGAQAIGGLLERTGVHGSDVSEVFMGNVVASGMGQAPARQAALKAGLPHGVPCTTINKVCASGMKAVMLASQSIMTDATGKRVMVAGGMESMSNVPYYLDKARSGLRFGNHTLVDGLVHDGLTDAYDHHHMGVCGDTCAEEHGFSREDQDAYAIRSYERARQAVESGAFDAEMVPVRIAPRRGGEAVVVQEDEEFRRINLEKVASLRPAFGKNGTVTAANASTLNDGASALMLMSEDEASRRGLSPLAVIRGFADAATRPLHFPVAPALAIPRALEAAGVSAVGDIDLWEINEAFSVVALANQKLLGMDMERLNVLGGGVSLGHPIGSSGARIIVTLAHLLRSRGKKLGCAAICNGGGGASAIVIEAL